jgi:hypothetical protein
MTFRLQPSHLLDFYSDTISVEGQLPVRQIIG